MCVALFFPSFLLFTGGAVRHGRLSFWVVFGDDGGLGRAIGVDVGAVPRGQRLQEGCAVSELRTARGIAGHVELAVQHRIELHQIPHEGNNTIHVFDFMECSAVVFLKSCFHDNP